MRAVCPSCHATYEIPDKLLGAKPRRLRCARCAAEWTADPQPVEAAGTDDAPLRAPAGDDFPHHAPPGSDPAGLDGPEPAAPAHAASARDAVGTDTLVDEPAGRGAQEASAMVAEADAPVAPRNVPAAPKRTWVAPENDPDLRSPTRPLVIQPAAVNARSAAGRSSNGVVAVGWALSVAVIVAAVVAAYVWRGPVMAAWPPSQRVYAALGVR